MISWADQALCYVLARSRDDGSPEVLRFGVERQATGDRKELVRKLKQLDLKRVSVRVMLRPEQYQMLQIDAPAVPPDELRAAARYQIKDMLHIPFTDAAIDVMRVGDGRQRGAGHLFVVATAHAVVQAAIDLCQSMHWMISAIDVQETAQRNLETALAAQEGRTAGANASLILVAGEAVVLTISANKELFYTRRFNLPEGLLTSALDSIAQPPAIAINLAAAITPSLEYQPGYSLDYLTYSDDVYPDTETLVATAADDDPTARFLVELIRSLDLWNSYWRDMPINHLYVYAGRRSQHLSDWLGRQLNRTTRAMNIEVLFPDFKGGSIDDQAACLPLLGLLLRDQDHS